MSDRSTVTGRCPNKPRGYDLGDPRYAEFQDPFEEEPAGRGCTPRVDQPKDTGHSRSRPCGTHRACFLKRIPANFDRTDRSDERNKNF